MTEREVAEILGGPGMTPAEELDPFEFEPSLEEPARPIRLVSAKIWYGRRGRIVIDLGQDNLVCWKFFQRGRRINGAILDRLRDWLGW